MAETKVCNNRSKCFKLLIWKLDNKPVNPAWLHKNKQKNECWADLRKETKKWLVSGLSCGLRVYPALNCNSKVLTKLCQNKKRPTLQGSFREEVFSQEKKQREKREKNDRVFSKMLPRRKIVPWLVHYWLAERERLRQGFFKKKPRTYK